MWRAQITNTLRQGLSLSITVNYTNGDQSFDDLITLLETPGLDWLQDQINHKLAQLANLDTFEQQLTNLPITTNVVSIDTESGIISSSPSVEVVK